MMAAVSATPNLSTTSSEGRPSETGNNVTAQRRLKPSTREVSSRYMSTLSSFSSNYSSSATISSHLSSRRSASPLASRTVSTRSATPPPTPLRSSSLNKRSQSAERQRLATQTPVRAATGEQRSAAAKVLMSSKRSLSLSLQGESLLTPISKTNPSPPPNFGKAMAGRRSMSAAMLLSSAELRENARSAEQRPWPARSRQVSTVKPLSKSVDLGSDRKKLVGRSANVVRSLKLSHADRADQVPCHDKLQDTISSTALLNGDRSDVSANLLNLSITALESATPDSESICSDSNSALKDNESMFHIQAGPQGVIVPARVWELTKNKLIAEPSSSLYRGSSLKETVSSSSRVNLTIRGVSPLRGGLRPASPSRQNTATLPSEKPSPSRAIASPTRVRNRIVATSGSTMCSLPSLTCFASDVRRGKSGQNRISDVHLLRLMCNRHLQWRFANSRVEVALSFQRLNAERNLYNTWKAMSNLRLSVCKWRLQLTRMSLKVKLFSLIKEQMMYLEQWAVMENDFVRSLLGATESFRVSTIQLPFVCGATADILTLKGAICSAVDVLQAMASSICSLMSEVEKINSLLDEVVSIATNEHSLLDECKYFFSTLAAFQVQDCSLRAHISQLKRVSPSGLPIEA